MTLKMCARARVCMYNVCAFINRHRTRLEKSGERKKAHKITALNEIIYMYRVVSNINHPPPPVHPHKGHHRIE